VREEFRSRIVELRALSPYLDKAWYSMRPMDYDELRAAVERPAAIANLQFQTGIVDDLVKKVLGQPAALPLLQFTLRLLWEERDRNRITWEVYARTGDPLNALKASTTGSRRRLRSRSGACCWISCGWTSSSRRIASRCP
jgi:conflict system STAND superfamily ATPase